jgi:hypothetical protein
VVVVVMVDIAVVVAACHKTPMIRGRMIGTKKGRPGDGPVVDIFRQRDHPRFNIKYWRDGAIDSVMKNNNETGDDAGDDDKGTATPLTPSTPFVGLDQPQ